MTGTGCVYSYSFDKRYNRRALESEGLELCGCAKAVLYREQWFELQ